MNGNPSSDITDVETRASGEDHAALRAWLRLLATTNSLEALVRSRLQARFATTLARFDYLSQLDRVPDGLRMGELSERLMVTNGNVTGLTDALESEGLVTREPDDRDRRAFRIQLTAVGRRAFHAMAAEHERWIADVFGGLTQREFEQLRELLGKVKARIHKARVSDRTQV